VGRDLRAAGERARSCSDGQCLAADDVVVRLSVVSAHRKGLDDSEPDDDFLLRQFLSAGCRYEFRDVFG